MGTVFKWFFYILLGIIVLGLIGSYFGDPNKPNNNDNVSMDSPEAAIEEISRDINSERFSYAIKKINNLKETESDNTALVNRLDSFYNIATEGQKLFAEKWEKRREAAKKKLKTFRENKDEFNKISYYRHSSSPKYVNQNGLFCYFSMEDGKSFTENLRFKIQYHGDDWLFIESCQFLIDGETTTYTPGRFERDNDSKVWEYNDSLVTANTLEMLKAIANSKETKMRIKGRQYHKDRRITSTQKKALKEVIEVYEVLSTVI